MKKDDGLEQVGSLFESRLKDREKIKKPPAYKWQDLALQVIKDLSVPNFKRSAVFKVCKENSREFILTSLNDTKELCQTGEKWKYFFKIVSELKK